MNDNFLIDENENFYSNRDIIPFSKIKNSDFKDAIYKYLERARKDIEVICSCNETPSFENTIVALENSGKELDRILNIFYPLLSAAADEELMNLSVELTPILSEFNSSIIFNDILWSRVKYVYENQSSFNLDIEDQMLLKKKYDLFRRNGALLSKDRKERLKKINSQLAQKTTLFGQNVLKELQKYEIYVTEDELRGLPDRIIDSLKEKARLKNHAGECLITLDQPTYIALMKYAHSRELRERIWRIYNERNTKGEYSNVDIVKDIVNFRLEKARLLGYDSYADFSLEHTMARNKENVYNLLNKLKDNYKKKNTSELDSLQKYASEKEGFDLILKPWDYSYYFNLYKNEFHSFNEEELRPYFPLDRVVEGLFFIANTLYGLSFNPLKDIDVYESGVKAFEVKDEDGSYLGLLYMDFFPRPNKRNGAWMTEFKEQEMKDGVNQRPVISIVTNLTEPTGTHPSLLSPSEVRTLLHEFGHAMHGILSQTKYKSLSGTNVERDFVELPSQFNENFLYEKEFLSKIGRHYETGEIIPDGLIDKIIDDQREGVGYACMRQLQFAFLDMAWHSLTQPIPDDIFIFENNTVNGISPFDPENGTSISTQFNHIFSGGYAAGYYSYKWSEVLDADAFSKFREEGIFNKETGLKFRKEILERGGSEDPDILYRRFRGRDPQITAMMERDGIVMEN